MESRATAGGVAVTGVVDRPDFDGMVGPVLGKIRCGKFRTGRVSGETQDISLGIHVCRGKRARNEDLYAPASACWNLDPAERRRIDGVCAGEEDEAIGDMESGQKKEDRVGDRERDENSPHAAFGGELDSRGLGTRRIILT